MPLQGRFFPKYPQKYKGNPNTIIFRSGWERTFMEYCDRSSQITKWASEELAISYYFSGDQKWHKYYPDFIIEVAAPQGHQVWLIEIKPLKETLPPQSRIQKSQRRLLKETVTYAKNQAKWNAATAFCAEKGWKFMILTEKDLYPKLK